MYSNALLLATTLTTCWANTNIVTQDNVPRTFPRLGRSLMTVASATLEGYASPTLPCNGEGFYSHVSDCTNFYRCIDVVGNRDYMRLAYKCDEGTIFSTEYKSCIAGTCSSGLAPSSAASAVASAAISASKKGSPQCSSKGTFADPEDCGQFYDCVSSHNGEIVAHQKSCFGLAFHPTLKACVPLHMVKGCISYPTRSIYVEDPKVQNHCSNGTKGFVCADCKTLVVCSEGISYEEPCERGSVCSMKDSFSGGICYPGDPVGCTCNEANFFRQDLYNPSKFLSCDTEGSDPIILSCPEGLEFDEQRRACGPEIISTCSEAGTFAVNDNCTRYYTCIFTTEGWIHKEFTCSNNTMFNEETNKCENPCDWYSGHFTCETEGRFANPADCTKYYECVTNPLDSAKFSLMEQECLEGLEWSQEEMEGAGLCVPSVTSKEKCVPTIKPNKCKIPNECIAAVQLQIEGNDTEKEAVVQLRVRGFDTEKEAIHCPEGHFLVGTQCFFIPMEGFKTWDDAQALCKEQGGFLAEPDSIPDFHKAISNESSLYGFWLGGSDREQEGVWRWSSDGANVGNSMSWYPGEPNNSGGAEDCLYLMMGEDQPLADRTCELEHHYFVCEKH